MPVVVAFWSPGEAVGSCQLCGQPAGKLLTVGVLGRRLEEVMSHPQNFIQTFTLIRRATWLHCIMASDRYLSSNPSSAVLPVFVNGVKLMWRATILCVGGRAYDSAPLQMERSWQIQDWWDTVGRGLALRHGDYGWRRSLSTAARKIWQEGSKQSIPFHSSMLQREMAGWGCIPANNFWLIVLMRVKCITVVMLAVEDMNHSACSVTH